LKRRATPLRILLALAALGALAVAYVTLAPASIGGSAYYSFTYGTSMEPQLHKGDLIVVREARSYAVGDAVLFENADLKRRVLHRIVAAEDGRFTLKGDNNAFVDTFQPTQDDILGELWFSVGGLGKATDWLAEPKHAAITTGLVALLSLLGSGAKAQRRRKRRLEAAKGGFGGGGKGKPPAAASALVPGQAAQLFGGIFGIVAVACAILAAIAFSRPVTTEGEGPPRYAQKGSFAYEADVPKGAVYEDGRLRTGEPAYIQVVSSVRFTFDYAVESGEQHQLFGTTRLVAELANGSGWSRTIELAPRATFSGDRATVSGVLPLAALRAVADEVEKITGQVPDTYTVTVRPSVALAGQIAGAPVKDAFAPELQLALDRYKLTLPPAGSSPTADLERSQDGPATQQQVEATLSFAGIDLGVQAARRLATVLGLAALVGAIGIGVVFLLGLRAADEPARIRARFGHLIVEILEPRRRFPEHDVLMASFDDLVRVSDRHARMILHAHEGGRHVYLVEDDGVAYRYEIADGTPPADAPAGPAHDAGDMAPAAAPSRGGRFMLGGRTRGPGDPAP
jgi:signal peptidase I